MQTRAEGIKVTGKVDFRTSHPMIEHFKFVQRMTKAHAEDDHSGAVRDLRPPDGDADRPLGLSGQSTEFFHDLGQAYRKAVRAFADAGCRYLQLDEVFIAMLCDREVSRSR